MKILREVILFGLRICLTHSLCSVSGGNKNNLISTSWCLTIVSKTCSNNLLIWELARDGFPSNFGQLFTKPRGKGFGYPIILWTSREGNVLWSDYLFKKVSSNWFIVLMLLSRSPSYHILASSWRVVEKSFITKSSTSSLMGLIWMKAQNFFICSSVMATSLLVKLASHFSYLACIHHGVT